jgi:hypothetical protein
MEADGKEYAEKDLSLEYDPTIVVDDWITKA